VAAPFASSVNLKMVTTSEPPASRELHRRGCAERFPPAPAECRNTWRRHLAGIPNRHKKVRPVVERCLFAAPATVPTGAAALVPAIPAPFSRPGPGAHPRVSPFQFPASPATIRMISAACRGCFPSVSVAETLSTSIRGLAPPLPRASKPRSDKKKLPLQHVVWLCLRLCQFFVDRHEEASALSPLSRVIASLCPCGITPSVCGDHAAHQCPALSRLAHASA